MTILIPLFAFGVGWVVGRFIIGPAILRSRRRGNGE